MTLGWGCNRAIPEGIETAWGARFIYPNDMLHDRQDLKGDDAEKDALITWLNSGALRLARESALEMSRDGRLDPTKQMTVTLYSDEYGMIKADPQGSYGYLYVSGWLFREGGIADAA